MKKILLIGMILQCLIFSLVSCDTLLEDIAADSDITSEEIGRDTDVSPEDSAEDSIEDSTELQTETHTEESSEEATELPPEGVTYEDEALNTLVSELRAEGYDMEKTTFSETHDAGNYAYTATLNARILHPGDTLEVTLADLFSYNEAVDIREYCELGSLAVWLIDYHGQQAQMYLTTEDFTRFTLNLPEDIEQGAYRVELYLNDWMLTVCPVIVYGTAEPATE